MRRRVAGASRREQEGRPVAGAAPQAQTLVRGLKLMEAVAGGTQDLRSLVGVSGLPRSTAHRLLSSLALQGYLRYSTAAGYQLGPKLIELGFAAHRQLDITSAARPHLEQLQGLTQETVNLAVLDGHQVLYVDKIAGSRSLQMVSYIGARCPAHCTALGKALVAGLPEAEWPHFIGSDHASTGEAGQLAEFARVLRKVSAQGYALDLEENEPGVRCVAAPVRDGEGKIAAAVSISGASVNMSDGSLREFVPLVCQTACDISRELGWRGP